MADAGLTFTIIDSPPEKKSGGTPVTFTKVETPSFGEGVGAGLVDKVYGAAQLGAHLTVPEDPMVGAAPLTQQSIDKTVSEREKTLKAQGYDEGWGRTVGNILGDVAVTAPLSFVPGGAAATTLGRMGMGALGGMAGGLVTGAIEPVTEGNYAAGKAKQIGVSTAGGAVAGGAFGALASAFTKDTPEAIDAFMKSTFRRNIKPSVAGKETFSQVEREQNQAVSAIEAVVENKANLVFTDEAGNVTRGEAPKTLDQFAQAIEQTKRPIYQAYDDLANASEFNIHAAEESASKQAVKQRRTELTAALARQSQGANVYQWGAGNRAVAEAQAHLAEAQQAARAAAERASATREILKRVQAAGGGQVYSSGKISTEPAIQTMLSVADTKAIRTVPAVRDAILKTAENLRSVGEFTATEMQDYIQFLNAELKSLYGKSTIPPGVAQAKALMAAKLRETLDQTVEGVAGPGYQALKNKYAALKAIEANVVKRAQVAGREPTGGGIIDRLTNIASAEELARAVMSFDPTALASAAAIKGAQMTTRYLKSPNRAVTRLFEAAERKPQAPTSQPPITQYGSPVIGGTTGDAAVRALGLQ